MAARTGVAVFGTYNQRVYGSFNRGGGTVVVEDFKNWAGTAQVSFTVGRVSILNLNDGSLVLTAASQQVDANGDMTITDASLIGGTSYMVVGWDATGANSFRRAVTAT